MAASSNTLHEASLAPETIDYHRAMVSLMEELEAVDWYNQRAEAATDDALRKILIHNRDEEKEHAAMALEWLRRRDQALDGHLRTYLFKEGAIREAKKGGEAESAGEAKTPGGSLGIGSLREQAS